MKAGTILIGIVVLIILIRQFVSSAFFYDRDRIQIVKYDETPAYYSLERGGNIHYVTTFAADSRTSVPGGYKEYRIGGLGRLVELEKKPELFKKTFSRITGSMTDFYFYPRSMDIYYGNKEEFTIPSASVLFTYASNANIFDRLYLWLQFVGKRKTALDEVKIKKINQDDKILLSDQTFARQYLGFFYQKTLREENKTVQIIYQSSYSAAYNISRIIDGEGVRVVDVDKGETTHEKDISKKRCHITEKGSGSFSKTAYRLKNYFGCTLGRGEGRLSDIVFYLYNTEGDWE